jgi:hypothetical protein
MGASEGRTNDAYGGFPGYQRWNANESTATRPTAIASTSRPKSPTLSELASWGDLEGGARRVDVPSPLPWEQQRQQQQQQQQRSSGYQSLSTGWQQQFQMPQRAQPQDQRAVPPYEYQQQKQQQQGPPPPSDYSYYWQEQQWPTTDNKGSPSSYSYPPSSFSAPLSVLAIQPHIEPLDRVTFGGGIGSASGGLSSSSSMSSPLPFAKLDSSDFRQPYRQGRGGGLSAPVSQTQWKSWELQQQQPPPPRPSQTMSQQQSRQQQQQRQSSSFQPLPFQSQPQSDFRQPYQGAGVGNNNDRGGGFGGESMWFDGSGPQSIGFYDGPIPGSGGYDRPPPPTSFGNDFDNGMFPASPFGVPPMMMFPQIPNGMSPPGQRSRSKPKKEEGVKVPKDPFVERQKQKKKDQAQASSSSSSSRSSTQSLPEPDVKIPKDPFAWKKQNGQPPKLRPQKQSQPKGQVTEAGNNNEVKRPTDPFLDRSRQILRPDNRPNRNDESSWRRSMVNDDRRMSPLSGSNDGGSNDDVKRPREPFTAKRDQVPQGTTRPSRAAGNNIGSSRSFGRNISFGSQSEEDMTFEEYSSYFDVP